MLQRGPVGRRLNTQSRGGLRRGGLVAHHRAGASAEVRKAAASAAGPAAAETTSTSTTTSAAETSPAAEPTPPPTPPSAAETPPAAEAATAPASPASAADEDRRQHDHNATGWTSAPRSPYSAQTGRPGARQIVLLGGEHAQLAAAHVGDADFRRLLGGGYPALVIGQQHGGAAGHGDGALIHAAYRQHCEAGIGQRINGRAVRGDHHFSGQVLL